MLVSETFDTPLNCCHRCLPLVQHSKSPPATHKSECVCRGLVGADVIPCNSLHVLIHLTLQIFRYSIELEFQTWEIVNFIFSSISNCNSLFNLCTNDLLVFELFPLMSIIGPKSVFAFCIQMTHLGLKCITCREVLKFVINIEWQVWMESPNNKPNYHRPQAFQ